MKGLTVQYNISSSCSSAFKHERAEKRSYAWVLRVLGRFQPFDWLSYIFARSVGSSDRWSDQGHKYWLFNWLIQINSEFPLARFFWSIMPFRLIVCTVSTKRTKVKLLTAKIESWYAKPIGNFLSVRRAEHCM